MNKYAEHSKVKEARQDLYRKLHSGQNGRLACSRKRQFDTEELAINFSRRRGFKQRAYQCPHCYCWHLTKKETV